MANSGSLVPLERHQALQADYNELLADDERLKEKLGNRRKNVDVKDIWAMYQATQKQNDELIQSCEALQQQRDFLEDLHSGVGQRLDKLQMEYGELNMKYNDSVRYIKQLKDKYVAAKDVAQQWRAWYDKHKAKLAIADTTATTPSRIMAGASETLDQPVDRAKQASRYTNIGVFAEQVKATAASKTTTTAARGSERTSRVTHSTEADRVVAHSPSRSQNILRERIEALPLDTQATSFPCPGYCESANRVTSSQTTEVEPSSSAAAKLSQHSDDTPIVVSARRVKRRRSGQASDPPKPRLIKKERLSSSPPVVLISDACSSPVMGRRRVLQTTVSDLDARVEALHTPHRHKSSPPAWVSSNESVDKNPARQSQDDKLSGTQSTASSGVLCSRSPNIPTSTSFNSSRKSGKRKVRSETLAGIVAIVSEDGDEDDGRKTTHSREDTSDAILDGRLESLLSSSVPEREPLTTRRSPNVGRVLQQQAPLSHHISPDMQEVERNATQPKLETRQPSNRRLANCTPPSSARRKQPLRSLPLSALRLEDFKINSKYMGADFAYSETFHSREQRRGLHAYTRADCTGDGFQKAAEIGGVQGSKTDEQVLFEYLGPNVHSILAASSPAKRDEMLREARAYAFAKQHGKQRQAFERSTTPPGFWRTDMASTQEAEEDRLRAQEMVKRKVEERWVEAQRKDGRWLFRDE